MTLSVGSRVGAYEIRAKIGAGGMGEVYRAQDTTLERDVAIKVLPEELSRDRERLSRFEREAKLLAQLNHPNVATIHGLEMSAGRPLLVMELIEGQTLAERMAEKPLSVEDAVPVFVQIAEGLEAAHAKGIVHRDLKPSNVKIDLEGRVKILDFGLAKALAGEATSPSKLSESPTVTRGTAANVILGTAAYMSPEQARGQAVDQRTDIWAFGVCLFEALTARSAFPGATVSDIIVAILEREPAWSALPRGAPASLRRVMKRCLVKDPKRRIQNIADARLEIQEPPDEEEAPGSPSKAPSWMRAAPWAIATTVALAVWFVGLGTRPPAVVDRPVQRWAVETEPIEIRWAEFGPILAIAPDGGSIVYRGNRNGRMELFRRNLDSFASTVIAGTENGSHPFFSPDGQWLGYIADGKLKKTSLVGGSTATLEDAAWLPSMSWGEDGSIVYGRDDRMLISRISANGGAPEPVTSAENARMDTWHTTPQVLPGGRAIVYTLINPNQLEPEIWAVSLETGESKKVVEGAAARWVRSGHLAFVRSHAIWAAPFDPIALELRGNPALVVDGVVTSRVFVRDHAQFDVSRDGTLAYVSDDLPHGNMLVWVDQAGKLEIVDDTPREQYGPRVSPDGRRISLLMSDARGLNQAWIYDLGRGTLTQSTIEGETWWRAWTPDGRRIVHAWVERTASARRDTAVAWSPADGSARPQRLVADDAFEDVPASVSNDGRFVFFLRGGPDPGGLDIWSTRIDPGGGGETRAVLDSPSNEFLPAISPDGRWLAYSSDEAGPVTTTGMYNVFVRPFPETGARWSISEGNGMAPVWSPDGKEIYYEAYTDVEGNEGISIMAVTWETEPEPSAGTPRLLFRGDFQISNEYGRNWDVAPDGRFLMLKRYRPETPGKIQVVLNWDEELKRLVPREN